MSCPFCDIDCLRDRIFFASDKWFAFLAAPAYARGHSIIAERPCGSVCPRVDRRGWGDLHCFGSALGEVATTLMKNYNPKDILFTSLRGDVRHFHVHLVPLWPEQEDRWRKEREERDDSYKKGHLMEFLGDLEKEGSEDARRERVRKHLTEDQQRQEIAKCLQPEVEELQKLTGYSRIS